MKQLLAIKNSIIRFTGKYENYLVPAARAILAFIVFMMIRSFVPYEPHLHKISVNLVLALICAFFPLKAVIAIAGILILINIYALSLSCALVAFLIFVVIYLIYFRFAPKDGLAFLLTPIAFRLHVPYVMPVGTSLLGGAYSVFSVICGTVCYYFLAGITGQSSVILEMEADSDTTYTEKINLALGQVLGNKDMYLVIAIFTLAAVVTWMLRRMNIDHAWTLAIISGILIELLGLFVGYMILSVSGKTVWLILGSIISLIICFILEFVFMNLDYARVERVQFEDDDYYYYVKAVPKSMVPAGRKKEIHFGHAGKSKTAESENGSGQKTEAVSEEE